MQLPVEARGLGCAAKKWLGGASRPLRASRRPAIRFQTPAFRSFLPWRFLASKTFHADGKRLVQCHDLLAGFMHSNVTMRDALQLRTLLAAACLVTAAVSAKAEIVEAIEAKASSDYVRKKLPDGTFATESYVFGKGDNLGGARVDPTIDNMDFMDVAKIIAVPLAEQHYLPTTDPKTTKLLIMVYWGTTRPAESDANSSSTHLAIEANQRQSNARIALKDAASASEIRSAQRDLMAANDELLTANIGIQAENQRREDADMRTATLLGYDSWWIATNAAMDGSPLGRRKADLKLELENDRYFVVLSAFDYQTLVSKKKMKFLWEVRFSIREQSNQFDKSLASMAAGAAKYFGRDSNGLHHDDVPEGRIEIGDVKNLGVVPEPQAEKPRGGAAK